MLIIIMAIMNVIMIAIDSNNQLFCFLIDNNYLKKTQNRSLIGTFLKTYCEN